MNDKEDKDDEEVRLGLVTDPDFPADIGEALAKRLPDTLPEKLSDRETSWHVDVVCDPVTAGKHSAGEILDAVEKHRSEESWDYAICLTDLPLQSDERPVMADADVNRRVAVISLPTLGGTQPLRRAGQLVTQLVEELRDPDNAGRGEHRLQSKLTALFAPVYRRLPDRDDVDVRYSATKRRGRARLLSGMVRGNRPWRLLPGMSGALAAAFATAAYGLITSTIWQLGDALSGWRMVLGVVLTIAAMTAWLIFDHHLWMRRRHTREKDRGQVWLYNTSTVLTLAIGVCCLCAVLFVVYLAVGAFLVDSSVLARNLYHAVDWRTYLTLAWGATLMGLAAGALGSGLESDDAVRQAAYGYRENQRQGEYHRNRERAERGED
jgi:hypothetical protein